MTTKEKDLDRVQNLKDGEECTVYWFEEGGGVVKRVGDEYKLYYVPQYGGEPMYEKSFPEDGLSELVDLAWTWT